MPPLEVDDLKQYAVMWEQVDYDENGRPTLESAIEIHARYETTLGEVISNADSTNSSGIDVVVDRDIPLGTQMRLGRLSEITNPLTGLLEVVEVNTVPDIKGRHYRRNVTLIKKRG